MCADERYAFKGAVVNPNASGSERKTQTMWLLTEAGLYRFLLVSRNKAAKIVANWLFFDVLPSLRASKQMLFDMLTDGKFELKNEQFKLSGKVFDLKNQKMSSAETSHTEIIHVADKKAMSKVVTSLYPELHCKEVLAAASETTSREKAVADTLQEECGGVREYAVDGGRIDLLTDTEIIEVKHIGQFKQACGQVQFYSHILNSTTHRKRVHLFSDVGDEYDNDKKEQIVKFSKSLEILVTFE